MIFTLLALLIPPLRSAPSAQAAPRTWTVLVGGGIKGTAVVANRFSPRRIEVAVGDTVTWQFQQPWTIHTVTFLSGSQPPEPVVQEGDKLYHNPRIFFPAGGKTYDGKGYVNSGVPPDLSKPFSYSLTFTKAGTYNYVCLLHAPPMSGTVVVRERVATSPAAAAAQGQKELAATLKVGQAAYANWKVERRSATVVIPLIGDAKAGWTILRFTRQPLVVKRGTTVTWEVRDPSEIHTVTFTGGQKPSDFVVPEPQQQGPPKLRLPSNVAARTTSKTHEGKGYVNSGILFPPGAPGNPPTTFTLTFTKPGKYAYFCIPHLPWGMVGSIIVK